MNVILFDMDGVLLTPMGYHKALQDTVRIVGEQLGFQNCELPHQTIAAFEAGGVTSEWDSSAICAALLLQEVWRVDPHAHLVPATEAKKHHLQAPDFHSFAHRLGQPELSHLHPLARAEALIFGEEEDWQAAEHPAVIRELLRNARAIEGSLTHRVFQELILGSRQFEETYVLPAMLNKDSYLEIYDRPNLSPEERQGLLEWLEVDGNLAAVFTSRPSRAPDGHFGTPEAEIGLELVDLPQLPIGGFGGLSWLGQQRRQDPDDFIKPSPVHSLAALQLALGGNAIESFSRAAALALDGAKDESWQALDGSRVWVFEDTRGGLISLERSQRALGDIGVSIEIRRVGVAQDEQKIRSLEAHADRRYAALPEALQSEGILPG